MSRAERRRRERDGGGNPGKTGSSRGGLAAAVGLGLLVVSAGAAWIGFGFAAKSHHPEPRPAVTAAGVMPAARYADYPRVREVYAQAREIPAVLDGLYCYCECSRHSGHRSLLTCFESDHGAACDVCLTEAAIAYRMTKDGRSLDEVRDAIDGMYGG